MSQDKPTELQTVVLAATQAADEMAREGRYQWSGVLLMARQALLATHQQLHDATKPQAPPPPTVTP